jgi:glycosyltransferase involved in cell wall biosynthesis
LNVLHIHTDLVGGGIERMMVTLASHTPANEVGICWCPASHPEPPEAALRELAAAGVTLHRIPRPFLSPRYPVRLARVIRRVRPDVLHLHGASIGVIGGIVGRVARVPAIVYTEHLEHSKHARWLQRSREMTAELPHGTVFVSERSFLRAVEEGPLGRIADRASVIHNGIDLSPYRTALDADERAEVREELGLDTDTIAAGCVGLLWEAKGQEYLIRALAELYTEGAVTVLLVGSGAYEDRLCALAKEHGVAEKVRFLGWRDDVPRILRALDLYVQPSLTEGLPLAVVEAAAAGLPIVASEVGGIPEIITHGRDGLLVPPGDPNALAAAIQKLLDDPDQARMLGETARKTAFERFSAEAMVERYMEVYEGLLQDAR